MLALPAPIMALVTHSIRQPRVILAIAPKGSVGAWAGPTLLDPAPRRPRSSRINVALITSDRTARREMVKWLAVRSDRRRLRNPKAPFLSLRRTAALCACRLGHYQSQDCLRSVAAAATIRRRCPCKYLTALVTFCYGISERPTFTAFVDADHRSRNHFYHSRTT